VTAPDFKKIVRKLESFYGELQSPKVTDPFELILWENVAYLVEDAKREKIFEELRRLVGLRPIDIFNASLDELDQVTKLSGMNSHQRSARLKESALIALNEFGGDLSNALELPLRKAIKALKQFPGIGEPGAEKILLLARKSAVLALDSNGLRVMLRLGFGDEKKTYAGSYKSVREGVANQCGDDFDELIKAYQLLRQHGKVICKTSKPKCDECPVNSSCSFYLQKKRTMA
jgi:endonuclease III